MTRFSVFLTAVIAMAITLTACNGKGIVNLDNSFKGKDEYSIVDFQLSQMYEYWEVRISNLDGTSFDIFHSYDDAIRSGLTDAQLAGLAAASSDDGFTSTCLPSYCAIYGVTVFGDSLGLQQSKASLLALFDDVDTEAELHWWLYAHRWSPLSYEVVADGYNVIAEDNDACTPVETFLLHVAADGTITQTELLKSVNTGWCA